jgi:transcription elongation factor Elf1
MSGFSTEDTCPNCGKNCDVYTDWKPYNYSSIQCAHCGLMIYPAIEYMDLEELNEYRINCELEPLTELSKQEFKG